MTDSPAVLLPTYPKRPIIVDEQTDGPCEICAEWDRVRSEAYYLREEGRHHRKCFRCRQEIGLFQNMLGQGFETPTAHHFHLAPVRVEGSSPVMGRETKKEELCAQCYYRAYLDAYPGKPLPELPFELVRPQHPKIREMLEREADGYTGPSITSAEIKENIARGENKLGHSHDDESMRALLFSRIKAADAEVA